MGNLAITDGNSVGYAAMHGSVLSHGGREVHGILGILGSLKRLLTQFPTYKPLILWDGHADFRYEVFPGYKDREGKSEESDHIRESWREQREDVKQAITALGITQLLHPSFEADDIAYQLVTSGADTDTEFLLITGDQDWLQMMRERVRWHDHRENGKTILWQDFHKSTGYKTTEAFVEAKVVQGDASDTIPGLGGVGATTALQLISTHGSIHNLIEELDSGTFKGKKSAVIKRLESNEPFTYRGKAYPGMRESLERNTKLVDLSKAPAMRRSEMTIIPGSYEPSRFESFCQERLFNSILHKWDIFMRPFEALQAQEANL